MTRKERTDRLLTTDETCEILGGITRQTLLNWRRQGRIESVKLGRLVMFRESDVLDIITFGLPERSEVKR